MKWLLFCMFGYQTWYFLARCFIHFSLLLHFLMTVSSKSFQLFLFCYNTIGKVGMRTPFMKSWYEKNYGFLYAGGNRFLHEIIQQKSREEVCIMQYNSVVSAIWERRGGGGSMALMHIASRKLGICTGLLHRRARRRI